MSAPPKPKLTSGVRYETREKKAYTGHLKVKLEGTSNHCADSNSEIKMSSSLHYTFAYTISLEASPQIQGSLLLQCPRDTVLETQPLILLLHLYKDVVCINEPSLLSHSYYFAFSFPITTCQLQVSIVSKSFRKTFKRNNPHRCLPEILPEMSSFLAILKISQAAVMCPTDPA